MSKITPRLYRIPKIHKQGNPLRPIVDHTGSIRYKLSHSLADLLAPLVGKAVFHAKNSKELLKDIKDIVISEDQILNSHYVVSLLTKTPINESLIIIRTRRTRQLPQTKNTAVSQWAHLTGCFHHVTAPAFIRLVL